MPGETILIPNNSNTSSNSSQTTYTVKRGDTLSEIALRYNTTVANLVRINNIKNPDLVFPGQKIVIYSSNVQINTIDGKNSCGKILYKIKYGDTLTSIAKRFGCTVNEIAKFNNIKNPNLIYAGDTIQILNCKN